MADSKISGLTELTTSPATTDYFVVVDTSDTTMASSGTTKKLSAKYVAGVPVGTIVPWIGGYFTDGSNSSYTLVLGDTNDADGVNAYLDSGWRVCNGAELNDSASTIFNGAGRYLPNLTDDRFLMGDIAAGGTGGSSTMAHTHSVTSNVAVADHAAHTHSVTSNVAVADHAAHTHYVTSNVTVGNHDTHTHERGSYYAHVVPDDSNERIYFRTEAVSSWTSTYRTTSTTVGANSTAWSYGCSIGGTSATGGPTTHSVTNNAVTSGNPSATLTHSVTNNAVTSGNPSATLTHSVTNNAVTSGAASETENRPLYLSCFYIMRVH